MEDKLFIALAGNIGCGKTTAAKLLSRHFGLELFDEPVIDNRFLANYYGDMRRWSFTLQLEFLIKSGSFDDLEKNRAKLFYNISQIVQIIRNNSKKSI